MDNEQERTWVPPDGEPAWMVWFDELSELPAREREARLAALAREQPELADRLAQLFAAEEGTSEILSGQVLDRAPELVAAAFEGDRATSPDEELAQGTQIGPYRLLGLLGRGGMGEVYCAERADGVFEQRVALKLVKRGMDSAEILRRFHRERQILARLEHPGIARILDGGTAPDGRPYFALELIEGEPILEHCRRVGSTLEERLRLVIAACEAVDAAHRNLVVHRDLKPSNLLVTAEGQVKLLDFGIAKLLAEEPDGGATEHERQLLTPGYAAPEQLLGEPVTTATDVYALGVILYELLTGRFPYPRRRPFSPAEAEEETVKRPSSVLRRASAEGDEDMAGIPDRRRFARRVQGDLDTVVLTALRRDPGRRYRSAADLAAELRRFLEGRPIQARPDSVLYRGRKLVLRHKLATAAVVVAVLSLLAGLAVSLREAEKARAQTQRAERVKDLLISIFREADPEKSQGPTLTAREILAAGALKVETELGAEPEVRAELLDAIAQIERSLGLYDPALETARTSLAVRQELFGQDSPEAALSLVTQAEVLASLGRLNEAQRLAEQARPAVERRYGPESPEGERLARIRIVLLNDLGQPDQALGLAQEMAAATRRRFGPESIETARRLMVVAILLGGMSRFVEAEKMAREGVAVLETSPEASLHERAQGHRFLGALSHVRGRYPEALRLYTTALDLERAAVGPRHAEVAFISISSGYVLSQMRRFPEAERVLREAIRILEPIDHYQIGEARNYLGFCLMGQERYAEAEQEFVEVQRFLRKKVDANHPLLWSAILGQGRVQAQLGRLDEAESTLGKAVDYFGRTVPGGEGFCVALTRLAEVIRRRGRPAEALALDRRALQFQLKMYGTSEHPAVVTTSYQIALDLLALGDPGSLPEARQKIDAALDVQRRLDPKGPNMERLFVASGRIALAANDHARARRDFTEAVSLLREGRGNDHPLTREAEDLLRRAG